MKLNDLKEWVESIVLPIDSNIVCFTGRYIESPDNDNKTLISISKTSGTTRPPFVRYNYYRIVVLSPKTDLNNTNYDNDLALFGSVNLEPTVNDTVQSWDIGETISQALECATDGDTLPKNAGGIKLLSNSSMAHTADNRIYFTLTIQVII